MDIAELLIGSRVEWVSDRLAPQDCKPRHLGRPVTATVFTSDDPDVYDSIEVIGILEGIAGNQVQISGIEYDFESMKNFRTWRVKTA